MKTPSKETLDNWHADNANWKGGFYYNKKDKRVFLEKRNPMNGITLNFANPKTYLFLLATVAFFGLIIYMIENK